MVLPFIFRSVFRGTDRLIGTFGVGQPANKHGQRLVDERLGLVVSLLLVGGLAFLLSTVTAFYLPILVLVLAADLALDHFAGELSAAGVGPVAAILQSERKDAKKSHSRLCHGGGDGCAD